MHFKLLIFTVACCAFFIEPAQSGAIKSAAIDTVSDFVSIGRKVAKAKGAAVVRAFADIASMLATAAGLKIGALGQASASMKGAVVNGLIEVGDVISLAGDKIAGSNSRSSNIGTSLILADKPAVEEVVEEVKVKTPTVVEQDVGVVVPCEQEAVELEEVPEVEVREPITYVEREPRIFNKVSNVWELLGNAAKDRYNGVGQIYTSNVREPVVYEIVNTPQRFEAGPMYENFQFKKK